MRVSRVTRFLSVVMMVVFPASMMMADATAAMLSASGHAMLNGAGVTHSTAVFSGDKIETASNSAATISANGSTVLVPASSSVQFRGDAIELQSGAAVISTTKGLKARVGDLTVVPASGSARYEVTTSGENVIIAARTGALSLIDANGTTTLQEGNTSSNNKRKRGGAVPGMGGGGGAGAIGAMGSGKAIAIGAAVAAAAIAIALLSSDTPPAVSPRTP